MGGWIRLGFVFRFCRARIFIIELEFLSRRECGFRFFRVLFFINVFDLSSCRVGFFVIFEYFKYILGIGFVLEGFFRYLYSLFLIFKWLFFEGVFLRLIILIFIFIIF